MAVMIVVVLMAAKCGSSLREREEVAFNQRLQSLVAQDWDIRKATQEVETLKSSLDAANVRLTSLRVDALRRFRAQLLLDEKRAELRKLEAEYSKLCPSKDEQAFALGTCPSTGIKNWACTCHYCQLARDYK